MRPKYGMSEPVRETRLVESRAIARKECALAQLHAVIARVRVSDNLARIVAWAQALSDELVKTELFGSGYFNSALHSRAHRDLSDLTGDIVGRHRLDERRWQAYCVAVGGKNRRPLTNSKNCVARTIEYGIEEPLIKFS